MSQLPTALPFAASGKKGNGVHTWCHFWFYHRGVLFINSSHLMTSFPLLTSCGISMSLCQVSSSFLPTAAWQPCSDTISMYLKLEVFVPSPCQLQVSPFWIMRYRPKTWPLYCSHPVPDFLMNKEKDQQIFLLWIPLIHSCSDSNHDSFCCLLGISNIDIVLSVSFLTSLLLQHCPPSIKEMSLSALNLLHVALGLQDGCVHIRRRVKLALVEQMLKYSWTKDAIYILEVWNLQSNCKGCTFEHV